jgi:hypothetical protein
MHTVALEAKDTLTQKLFQDMEVVGLSFSCIFDALTLFPSQCKVSDLQATIKAREITILYLKVDCIDTVCILYLLIVVFNCRP